MIGLLHAAQSPFDSVLTPCRVMFSFRFAISSFRASVSEQDPLVLCGETAAAPCEFTATATLGTDSLEVVDMFVNCCELPVSGPDD